LNLHQIFPDNKSGKASAHSMQFFHVTVNTHSKILKKHRWLGKKEYMMTLCPLKPASGVFGGETVHQTDMKLVHQESILSWILRAVPLKS
jgi:hypothetical protein